jgi:hypothetical protein
MVGQLPLEQHIGVRIPGGQPNKINNLGYIVIVRQFAAASPPLEQNCTDKMGLGLNNFILFEAGQKGSMLNP